MREISLPRTLFDEDSGVFDDQDEVYATAGHFEVAGVCDGCCS